MKAIHVRIMPHQIKLASHLRRQQYPDEHVIAVAGLKNHRRSVIDDRLAPVLLTVYLESLSLDGPVLKGEFATALTAPWVKLIAAQD
jgi:hypothetical protein